MELEEDEGEVRPVDGEPDTLGEIFRIRIGVTPVLLKLILEPYFCDMGRIGFRGGRWS